MGLELGKTLQEIIDYIDDIVPNAFTVQQKVQWIAELDGDIALQVMKLNDANLFNYSEHFPDSMTWHVFLSFPYDNIYALWLRTQIDFGNNEYDKDYNAIAIYNARLVEFQKWFLNNYFTKHRQHGEPVRSGRQLLFREIRYA
ncbi:MAG: hypothetical protein LBN43_06275 [Oscillospiraceae bacterium]|jgi:hypothetical protein|nr:hypothetical protein [Oscillospiraceae bacterium]